MSHTKIRLKQCKDERDDVQNSEANNTERAFSDHRTSFPFPSQHLTSSPLPSLDHSPPLTLPSRTRRLPHSGSPLALLRRPEIMPQPIVRIVLLLECLEPFPVRAETRDDARAGLVPAEEARERRAGRYGRERVVDPLSEPSLVFTMGR
jgi:hypothetical protein